MSSNDPGRGANWEQALRTIATEMTRAGERLSRGDLGDLERIARATGIDPERTRSVADDAGRWLRDQFAPQGTPHAPTADAPAATPAAAADPSPLDLPTSAQGRALAAIDSGRWTVEPGTVTLATQTGKGAHPQDAQALGLELHVRDWVDEDGDLTVAGVHALQRWLDAAAVAVAE
ncbi:hypothetical protein [Patulibacter sp. SYSU D01012]|uniref:hypothetical protein n=1 Tax=Patulibacter sp. SYSU D01012 TaxID=2817381 RepID=UPI001B3090EB|nr:hypothetical protein [Patulibacter sp. SYSU D01012]